MTNAREFTARLADLLRSEHAALADFLILLADFDQRRLWVDLGYPSLFTFLHRELGLSKGAAHYRKTAAEILQRFPEIAGPLRDGRPCITSIVELAKVLSPENKADVLPRFFHCSKSEAAEVAAELRPEEAPPRRELATAVTVSKLAASSHATAPGAAAAKSLLPVEEGAVQPVEPAHAKREAPTPSFPPRPQRERDEVEPLTAELRRFHVTVSKAFLRKLDAARSALSYSRPGATAEQILEAGLDLLLAREAKAKKAGVEKPRASTRPCSPDQVPAHVRREVWKRDRGCCQWRLDGGGICGSTFMVEVDHIVPRALGGLSTIENLRLLCLLCRERHKRHYADCLLMPRVSAKASRAWQISDHDAA